jgi:hypothetical protein
VTENVYVKVTKGKDPLLFEKCIMCIYVLSSVSRDVRYDFHIKTMFGSSLPPVVCRRVIYVNCVCLRVVVSNT